MKLRLATCFILFASCCLPAFADNNDNNAPDLGAYVAYPPPQKSRIAEFFSHVYISGKIGGDFARINDINTPTPQVQLYGSAQQTTFSKNILGKGVALGYTLPAMEDTLFNRVEVEYMSRSDLNYNSSPPFSAGGSITSTLASTVSSDTVLAKWYAEFKFGNFPLRPFAVGGIGLAHNVTKSNATYDDNISGTGGAASSNLSVKSNNLAWDVGAGLAYYFNSHVGIDVDYEYVSLGSLEWDMSTNAGYTAVLQSNQFYVHTLNAALKIIL